MSSRATSRTDAEVVDAIRSGDRDAFAELYDRYADPIHDFCRSLLRDATEAADVTHDVFLYAAERISALRDPAKVRAWLYAIARNSCLQRFRKGRHRSHDDVDLAAMPAATPAPDEALEHDELVALVWSAAAGLSTRDQALLDLHVRHGLDGQELAAVIGESPSQTYVLLSRMRDQVERSIGALLVARKGRKDCEELQQLLEPWDGTFSPLWRKRVARHVDQCEVCTRKRLSLASPLALFGESAAFAAPISLRTRVLGDADKVLGHKSARRAMRSKAVRRLEGRARIGLLFGAIAIVAIIALTATAVSYGMSAGTKKRAVVVAPESTTTVAAKRRHPVVGVHIARVTHPRPTIVVTTSTAPTIVRLATVPPTLAPAATTTPQSVLALGQHPTPTTKAPTTKVTTTTINPNPSVQLIPAQLTWSHSTNEKSLQFMVVGGHPGDVVHATYTFNDGQRHRFQLQTPSCLTNVPTGTICYMTVYYYPDVSDTGPEHGKLTFHVTGAQFSTYTVPLIGDPTDIG
jgi:RNA polymerase sigma factor (sigma-70 family)